MIKLAWAGTIGIGITAACIIGLAATYFHPPLRTAAIDGELPLHCSLWRC